MNNQNESLKLSEDPYKNAVLEVETIQEEIKNLKNDYAANEVGEILSSLIGGAMTPEEAIKQAKDIKKIVYSL